MMVVRATRVAVIVPTRNRPQLTVEAIRSVQAQTFGDWHLYVVDDASQDTTAEAVQAHVGHDPRVTLIRRFERGGANAARQSAFEMTSSPLIALCDSDDLWEPTKLSRQVNLWDELIAAGKDPGWVTCWHDAVGADGLRRGAVLRPRRNLRWHPFTLFNTSTPLISRTLLESTGGFAPEPSAALTHSTTDHLELFLRLTADHPATMVEEVLVHCRHHGGPRNSDDEHTRSAAQEAERLLAEVGAELRPGVRAWLAASVAARYLEVGDRATATTYGRQAWATDGLATRAHLAAYYGPWAAREALRSRRAGPSSTESSPDESSSDESRSTDPTPTGSSPSDAAA